AGRADFVPIFLSDIPHLFSTNQIKLDAAIVHLSVPDKHGLCTLGTAVDATRAAVDAAPVVIAEVNSRMPRTHGHSVVPLDRVTAFTVSDRPLHDRPRSVPTDVENRIGELVARLVPDRACLQMGIGGIPDAVLAKLHRKQDLGVHTEMFSDGLVDLV